MSCANESCDGWCGICRGKDEREREQAAYARGKADGMAEEKPCEFCPTTIVARLCTKHFIAIQTDASREELAKVVAWLRLRGGVCTTQRKRNIYHAMADALERGEHRK